MWRYHPFIVGSDYDTDIFDKLTALIGSGILLHLEEQRGGGAPWEGVFFVGGLDPSRNCAVNLKYI